ncbi:MAG: efflux RND transporter periplasmic adaptor subunit [Bacteroidetes bacterium]|nr:efflux RND transporter periplasmic adaptor subunit [Bacteroidota bacterium]
MLRLRPNELVLTMFTLIFFLQACKDKPKDTKPKQAQNTIVDVLVASPQNIANSIEVSGTVVANEFVQLQPEASGRLTYLNVPEGKRIAAGTVIAIVNNADLKAQVEKSKSLYDLAQKTVERYKQLLAVNGMNQSDYDAAVNTMNGYKADIDYYQALLEKTILKAPFDGIIGLRQVSLGAYVSPTTLIATIQQLDKIKVDFTLPEQYSSVIKIGATVSVSFEQSGNKKEKATIIAVEPQVNQNSRNLTVRAVLQSAKANPGGFAKVYVDAGADVRAIMIPTNSLIPDDKNNQVILIRNGKADFVNVKTGVRLANNVEITNGVNAGDTVVVTGVLFARPKSSLQVRSVKTLEQFAQLNNNSNGAD